MPEKYNDYQPIVLPSPPKTEIVAVGLENDNAFANKKPLDWEYVQRKTKFLTDRAKEKSDQLEWRLKQLEFENKKLLGLIPADQNLESRRSNERSQTNEKRVEFIKGPLPANVQSRDYTNNAEWQRARQHNGNC